MEPFDRSVWEEECQFVHEHYPAGTDIVSWYYKIEKEQLSNSQLNLLYSAMKQYDINCSGEWVWLTISRDPDNVGFNFIDTQFTTMHSSLYIDGK